MIAALLVVLALSLRYADRADDAVIVLLVGVVWQLQALRPPGALRREWAKAVARHSDDEQPSLYRGD